MYIPEHFREDSLPVLHNVIREIRFGTLTTADERGIEANHFPMLIDETKGPLGTLCGHMARANPQWQRAKSGNQALAIFLGPSAYVTPSWYPSKRETGRVVPTRNYIAIHAYGEISFYDDPSELKAHVSQLTDVHEANRSEPWSVSDAPADFIERMIAGIVGFRLAITNIQGKWKMSQNRTAADMAGAREGLAREGREESRAVAAQMADGRE